jgi:DNA polymerase-1
MNRKAIRKPLVLKPLREYLIESYGAKLKPMLEGDDVMGILATHPTLVPGKKIIVSVDKDMKTIPGLFYRNLEGKGEMLNISPAEACYWHMYQTLVGDTSDGYKGCPGVGPKAAEKILTNKHGIVNMWTSVVAAFKSKGFNEAAALVQARVARILHHTDYNFETKQPILWNPPPPTIQKGTDEVNAPTETTNPPATVLQTPGKKSIKKDSSKG